MGAWRTAHKSQFTCDYIILPTFILLKERMYKYQRIFRKFAENWAFLYHKFAHTECGNGEEGHQICIVGENAKFISTFTLE